MLIVSSALADLDLMIEGHNMYSSICSAIQLKGSPQIDEEKGTVTYTVADELFDIFFLKNGEVTGFGCVCRDPVQEIEFLAQCVTACYNVAGDQAGNKCFDIILSQFMFARSGNPLNDAFITPDVAVNISKTSFGYLFVLSKVK